MGPYFGIVMGVYLLDLATKWLVRSQLPLGAEIKVLPFFSLVHIQNSGIAFGLLQGNNLILLILGVLIASLIVWYSLNLMKTDKISALILGVVLGGAMGNLTDRIFFGRVTDFLDFYIGSAHWPAFNVADSAISVGAVLLIYRSFKVPIKKES